LAFQHEALERLRAAGVPCQAVVPTPDGRSLIHADQPSDEALGVRLVTWLPGQPLATIDPADRPDELLRDVGRVMGRTARACSGARALGDAVWPCSVNELAVAAAYAALDALDPIHVVEQVRAGFEAELPLAEAERAVVVELVALRLTTSVALSAHQSRLDPGDAYLTVSEAPAWALLERLAAV